MNKKEFYVAPEWGMRVIHVERNYLLDESNFGNSSIEIPGEGEGGELGGDD